MSETGGVGGFQIPESTNIQTPGSQPTGDASEVSAFQDPSKALKGLNLTSNQMDQVNNARAEGGFGGPISPLEIWFLEHSGDDPIAGILAYQRFINSMMLTAVTGMSGASRASMERQKQSDRQAYGNMA